MKKNEKQFGEKLYSNWKKWQEENAEISRKERADIEKLEGKEKLSAETQQFLTELKRFQKFMKKQEKIVNTFYGEPKKEKK